LAGELGVDQEELERHIYRLFSESVQVKTSEQEDPLADAEKLAQPQKLQAPDDDDTGETEGKNGESDESDVVDTEDTEDTETTEEDADEAPAPKATKTTEPTKTVKPKKPAPEVKPTKPTKPTETEGTKEQSTMHTVTASVNQRLKETAVSAKKLTVKRFKYGVLLYVDPDDTKEGYQLTFEEASFDYDSLESIWDLYQNVPCKNVFTGSLRASSPQEMITCLVQMRRMLPKKLIELANFTKPVRKMVGDFLVSSTQTINYLQLINNQ
jgi:hypothetical protein